MLLRELNMKDFVADKSIKLSKFLLEKYDGDLSFSTFNKLLRKKDIKVNDKRVNKDVLLNNGDKVVVYFDSNNYEIKYKTIYEDDNIVINYKPKEVTSEAFYNYINKDNNLLFCHRLDRNTDGLMVFAKNQQSYQSIFNGFKSRAFKKIYRAKVYGKLEGEAYLTGYLFKDSKNSLVTIYDHFVKGSLPIKTYYKSVYASDDYSLLDVELITGRTHQIRAHLAFIGHFILGDGKYGYEKINRQMGINELCLQAKSITFYFGKEDYLFYLNGKTFSLD